MKLYYWDAKWLKNGEECGGIVAADSEDDAIKEIERYGYYGDIRVYEQK